MDEKREHPVAQALCRERRIRPAWLVVSASALAHGVLGPISDSGHVVASGRACPRSRGGSVGRVARGECGRRALGSLAYAAGAATAALVAAEVLHVWRRGRARTPRRPRDLVRGGAIAARETAGVVRAGYQAGSANETAALNLFVAFGVTFAAARAVTHSIRRGVGPLRNVRVARRHIHDFVPGIILALLSGGASILMRQEQLDHWLALPFGAGAALIVDETALLIELSDVYWSERGVLSVDVSLGAISTLACLTLLIRMVRRGEAVVLAA